MWGHEEEGDKGGEIEVMKEEMVAAAKQVVMR
jgi:hypothetical protein